MILQIPLLIKLPIYMLQQLIDDYALQLFITCMLHCEYERRFTHQ